MRQYDFTLIFVDSPELTPDLADALVAAWLRRDETPGTANGAFCINFHREASTFEAAIRSAIEDVNTAGYEAPHVEWS